MSDHADMRALAMYQHTKQAHLGESLWLRRDYPGDHPVVLVTQCGWPLGVRCETGHDTTLEALRRMRETQRVNPENFSGAYIVRARSR